MCDGFSIFRFLFYVSIIRLSVWQKLEKASQKHRDTDKACNEWNGVTEELWVGGGGGRQGIAADVVKLLCQQFKRLVFMMRHRQRIDTQQMKCGEMRENGCERNRMEAKETDTKKCNKMVQIILLGSCGVYSMWHHVLIRNRGAAQWPLRRSTLRMVQQHFRSFSYLLLSGSLPF